MKYILTCLFLILFLNSKSQELIEFRNEDYGFEIIELKLYNDKTFEFNLVIPKIIEETEAGAIYKNEKFEYKGKWKNENQKIICDFDSMTNSFEKLFETDAKVKFRIEIIDSNSIEFSNQTDTIYILDLPVIKLKQI